ERGARVRVHGPGGGPFGQLGSGIGEAQRVRALEPGDHFGPTQPARGGIRARNVHDLDEPEQRQVVQPLGGVHGVVRQEHGLGEGPGGGVEFGPGSGDCLDRAEADGTDAEEVAVEGGVQVEGERVVGVQGGARGARPVWLRRAGPARGGRGAGGAWPRAAGCAAAWAGAGRRGGGGGPWGGGGGCAWGAGAVRPAGRPLPPLLPSTSSSA